MATMRSVIQRYQAGESSMSGRTGPNMKMLPKKLPRNRVMRKYRPLTDTIIIRSLEIQQNSQNIHAPLGLTNSFK